MKTMPIRILPSILAADMANLEADCRRALTGAADGLHVDIMDGHFVPNLSMGPAVVAALRRALGADIWLHVHLMVERPDRYVEPFIKAGANTVLIHIESAGDIPATLQTIRERGARPGITLNPATPAAALDDVMGEALAEEILCMTVVPGFGGQSFMPEVLPKIAALRHRWPHIDISVDGGIDSETALACAAHGANVLLAGTSLFGATDLAGTLQAMRKGCAAVYGQELA